MITKEQLTAIIQDIKTYGIAITKTIVFADGNSSPLVSDSTNEFINLLYTKLNKYKEIV